MTKMSNEEFIEAYKNKFENIKLDDTIFNGTMKPLTVECIIHGKQTFTQARSFMNSKFGCKQCSKKSKSTEQFIKEAKEIFPEYDYSITEYKNKNTKIKFICKKHGIREILPNNMLFSKHGCSECGIEKISQKKLIPEEVIIKKSIEIFGDAFENYTFEYPQNSSRRITMTCKKHNYRFSNTVNNHINLRQGCKLCAIERQKKAITKTAKEFVEDCKTVYNDLYSFPDIEKYYINENTKINIKCNRCNNTFERRANAFLNQNRTCPCCDCSNAEVRIFVFLQKNNLNFNHHFRGFNDMKFKDNLEFDFWIPELNVAIEAQGEQHYIDNGWKKNEEFKLQQTRDQIKREYCKSNNINLIEIPYWEFNNIELILKDKLNLNGEYL